MRGFLAEFLQRAMHMRRAVHIGKYFKLLRWRLRLPMCRPTYDTIRHDTMREFNVD